MSTFGLPGCSGLQTSGGGGAGIANQYANLAALYAGKGALSNGDQWELLDTGRTGIKSTTLGIDDLFPHPFEQGMYPINSTTMALGALADGKLNVADGTGASLTAGALRVAFVVAAGTRTVVRFPGETPRPGVLSFRFKLVSGTPGASQNFLFVWVRSAAMTIATQDTHGGLLQYNATNWRTVSYYQAAGASTTETTNNELLAIESVESWFDVCSHRAGAAKDYYETRASMGFDGFTAESDSLPLAANNGMDLTSATESFYPHVQTGVGSATDWYVDISEIGFSRLWNGAAE